MVNRLKRAATLLVSVLLLLAAPAALAEDWPQWQYDAGHTAVSPEEMPSALHLHWIRNLPKPKRAWPEPQFKLHFDNSYEPIVLGDRIYVGSMTRDSLTAYATDTGKEAWRFYAEGPIRFAPVGRKGKVFAVSDDGFLYCLDAATGALEWKRRGGPDNRRGLGNGRLGSLWPARGAPLLFDPSTGSPRPGSGQAGQAALYFGAGLWPFMGVFLYAVDPDSGEVLWEQSGAASRWTQQPHGGALAFGMLAPQGYLTANDQFLFVPNSRNVPAVFDRQTGRFVNANLLYKIPGGYALRYVFGGLYVRNQRLRVPSLLKSGGEPGFLTNRDQAFQLDRKNGLLLGKQHEWVAFTDKKGRKRKASRFKTVWSGKLDPMMAEIHLKTAGHIYGTGPENTVLGVCLSKDGKATVDFREKVDSRVWRMLAAHERLFVVTFNGTIYCFGKGRKAPRVHALEKAEFPVAGDAAWKARAQKILQNVDASGGYCVALGIGSGRLIDEILKRSNLYVVAIDPDAKKVDAWRRRMDALGLYGERVQALVGDPFDCGLPPYLATRIVSEDLKGAGFRADKAKVRRLIAPLRPYGGTALLPGDADLLAWAKNGDLDGADVTRDGDFVVIRRPGSLPGSAPWSHQYADAGNSVVGADDRVKLPLGLLWFGGSTHLDVLPRHGHGPSPQIVAGRLVIEGINLLSARDVYTGRVLWKRELKNFPPLGTYYNQTFNPNIYDTSYNQRHMAGANLFGANYVTTADRVYAVHGSKLLFLNAATGKTEKELAHPPTKTAEKPNWGVVLASGDLLVAAAEPFQVNGPPRPPEKRRRRAPAPAPKPAGPPPPPISGVEDGVKGFRPNVAFAPQSKELVVLDRHSGKRLWSRRARLGYRHNGIVIAGATLFCLDSLSAQLFGALRAHGQGPPPGQLLALDLRTGKVLWKTDKNVTGTWLGYSEKHDLLIQCGSASRDRGWDEARAGIAAYRGKDGTVVWQDLERKHEGPLILWGDVFFTNGGDGYGRAYDLRTGAPVMRAHPLTGKPVHWTWRRFYGCNTARGSKHLFTFRSGTAGFYDVAGKGGTGNWGGFKSSCTSNLIPADGVLNAPDYTRTCICAYPNQTSLALVHMPDVEIWTFNVEPAPKEDPILRVGLNLGAPGDRAHGGTLWLDTPSEGSPSPGIGVGIVPEKVARFRAHTSRIRSGPLRWVAASGIEGLTAFTVPLVPGGQKEVPYTVRLVLAEPKPDAKKGTRVFDLSLQGKGVKDDFDVVDAAGGPRRSVVLEFKGVAVKDNLKIELKPEKGKTILCGIECVRE